MHYRIPPSGLLQRQLSDRARLLSVTDVRLFELVSDLDRYNIEISAIAV